MSEMTSEDIDLLRNSVSAYLAHRYDDSEQRRQSEAPLDLRSSHWMAFANELGLLGLSQPQELGGVGAGAVEQIMVMKELGRHVVLEPYLSSVIIAGRALADGSLPDSEALVQGLIAGESTFAFAHSEPNNRYAPSFTALRAISSDGGFSLQGDKSVVLDAPLSTHLIVSARTSGEPGDKKGLSLFLIERAASGLKSHDYRTISGRPASDFEFEDVFVSNDALLTPEGDALELIETIIGEATLMLCAEGIGVMRRLLDDTVNYTHDRKQFGQSLASFQALQHRMADMIIALEHSQSLVDATAAAFAESGKVQAEAVSACKVFVGNSLRFVAQNAVQLHGGMGTTDELFIGMLFKRATEIVQQFGTTGYHLKEFDRSRLANEDVQSNEHEEEPVGDKYKAFREEVRRFIADNFTDEKRELAQRQTGLFAEQELGFWWHSKLHAKGWAAPSWPEEYGGPGWDAIEKHIFASENARAVTPVWPKLGQSLAAPALMQFGRQDQKDYFLPRILSGEVYFCQGFSEPGSGSDLASLRTRADRDGEDYIINGSKIWTTHAHLANWIFMLVRTSHEGRPQTGISFLLVPMDTPGINVRPIISMSGEHEVNEVFFDNVRVPISNRVGEENQGWTVAKYLLEFERGGEFAAMCAGALNEARLIALQQPGDYGDKQWADDEFRLRYRELEIDIRALTATEHRIANDVATGESVGDVIAAILKITGSELYQRSTELVMEGLGNYALPDQREAIPIHRNAPPIGPDYAVKPTAKYLNTRAWSIFGGSNEVLRNIIARKGCAPT